MEGDIKPKIIYGFSPTPKRFVGITLFPFIFTWYKKGEAPDSFIKHELCHFRQVQRVGFFSFYISYLLYFLAGLLYYKDWHIAYWLIPYEVKAREAERD